MKVGLYFGTYNPIHVGHLIIANHMVDYTDLDQVWFIVSPQNPFKTKASLLEDYHRLTLVKVAIEGNKNLRASNIEYDLPKPSYTIDTLTCIQEKHPEHNFSIIMGEDNLRSFHKWKNYEQIIENHHVFVYPRVISENGNTHNIPDQLQNHPKISICSNAPLMKISASFIRKAIKDKKDVKYLLTEPVFKYLEEMNFYKK
ncbi:MAG: nicotinate (nicotinamide) nucleotide adenylyltransferase [Vicingaceae bacterium]|nr:nicotinate (nicotinamide) nucleotide adenylyltransferase [Vicingaceae bacterium]